MKYIDANKLNAEIDRLYNGEAPKHDQQCNFVDGYFTGIDTISQLIDSLQQEQPEVDLEKEIDDELDRNWRGYYIERRRFVESVKYFYNLGLNARKEESK